MGIGAGVGGAWGRKKIALAEAGGGKTKEEPVFGRTVNGYPEACSCSALNLK